MPELLSKLTNDTDTLAKLGKKQVLKRRFGFWSLFAFAICELITWETVLALFSQGLDNGGPGGLVYGFIIAWLSTLSVYICIAELASIAPIASGQYYWVYMLAPQGYKKASSYVIGWLTSLAWIATVATESLFAGTIIQGLLILRYPDYDSKMWQGTLLTWLVIAVNVAINVLIPGIIPRFELFWMALHLTAYVAIMAALLSTADIGSAHTVFLTSLNEGGWSTQGLSYCIGFLGNVATFVGADASVHMAEEVDNAALNIPRAIVTAMTVNGLIGFGMMITVLFCLGDIDTVLETATGFPFIQVFYNSFGTVSGAVAAGSIVLALTWACALGITTTASRMTWSFARDRGTPASRWMSHVSTRTRVPYVAVFAVCIIAALLTLIYIGSYTAFNDVISLTITGFYGSYFLPCALLLYHRIKGHIMPYGTEPDPDLQPKISHSPAEVQVAQARLIWGPWSVPGILGTINNAYACVYMIFVIFWSVWPPQTPVTASTMNYSVVVTGGVMILSGIWYFVRARKVYKGPIVDEDVAAIVMRRGSVVAER
ncbi:amino acid transporter [Rhizodiscina lignyota]|uniref:Amino acid transporter n=1 Tax=Rhizodiscina lignyota TaxID=1504668 RepID=A0A9P4IHA5_9PEZI|nr:amino acid transporter [Rhizodiscina lignyota]